MSLIPAVSAAYMGPPAAPIAPSTVRPEPTAKCPGYCTHPVTITSPPPGTTITSPGSTGMLVYFPAPVSEVLLSEMMMACALGELCEYSRAASIAMSVSTGLPGSTAVGLEPELESVVAAELVVGPAMLMSGDDAPGTPGSRTISSAALASVPPARVSMSRTVCWVPPESCTRPGAFTAPTTATWRLWYS